MRVRKLALMLGATDVHLCTNKSINKEDRYQVIAAIATQRNTALTVLDMRSADKCPRCHD
jgi:hypothetical protein